MSSQVNCCIAGINGYVGQVLYKLIENHPYLTLRAILVKSLSTSQPGVNNDVPMLTVEQLQAQADEIDVLLLATPADVSIELVESLYQTDLTIIDLSGAFRLPVDKLKQWYGLSHQLNDFKNGAYYGISPFGDEQLRATNLIANPGCYATGALLTLMPLLQNNIIDPNSIIIDAKSGVSGAGKKANSDLLFAEVSGNFMPYKVGKHQHLPEIHQCLLNKTGKDCQLTFVTQLLPIKSGIAMSVYCQAKQKWINDSLTAQVISEVFNHAYQDYPMLQFGQLNQGANSQDKYLLSLNTVVGTPNIHMSFHIENGNVSLFTCLDNLWKGAASQAVENINTLYQWPVNTGLERYKGGV